jgi:hypothetical protein
LVIALVAAIVLVGAAVAGHFVFFSGGSGSSPRAAAKAWLDAVDAEDFTKVQQLTCAQDRNFMSSRCWSRRSRIQVATASPART